MFMKYEKCLSKLYLKALNYIYLKIILKIKDINATFPAILK